MKLFVAVLLVLSIFSSGAVAQNPTASRRTNNGTITKSRSDTIRICQGLPMPEGYVVIAYMTSSACPHGAYVLKKQNDFESTLTVNAGAQPTSDSATPSNRTSTPSPKPAIQQTRTSALPTQNSAGRRSPAQTATSAQPVGNVSTPAAGSASVSRPRRVSTPESEEEGPPTLIGSGPAAPLRPPVLANAGTATTGTSEEAASKTETPSGPEEVGEGDVLRVDTTLVTVPVSVLDRQGRFVPNLKREDFSILENGVEQSIAYFEPAEKPFTVALLLDTSASTHFHLWEIREAAIAFAKQLRPQDRVLVVSFNQEVLLLTEATNDLNTIETVVEENANTGTSTRLYDAVALTIKERLNKIKGRKAIVLFTDGVDTSSEQATYQSTLREVEELDALIYPIQYDTTDYLRAMQSANNGTVSVTSRRGGPFGMTTSTQTYNVPMNGGAPLPGTTRADYDRADQYLHALADKTGGRLYQANDTAQLADAFSRIAEELRRQYSLGYYPKTADPDANDRRQIKVRVHQPNLAVRARDSYTKSSSPGPNK